MKRFLSALVAVLLDPPGWIPAWTTTAVLLALAWRGMQEPAALEPLRIVADVLKTTLTVWLGYKGLRAFPDLVGSLRELFKGSSKDSGNAAPPVGG